MVFSQNFFKFKDEFRIKNFFINFSIVVIYLIFLSYKSVTASSNIDDDLNIIATADQTDYDDDSLWRRILKFKFVHAFVVSFSIIIVSELGDKTFFIAAILAMKQNRWTVFTGAISALVLMTILSSVLGYAVNIFPRSYTHYASIFLLFVFGIVMLKEGYYMTGEESKEELDETEKTISKKESSDSNNLLGTTEDPETGVINSIKQITLTTKFKRRLMQFFSLAFIETFSMTFLAEWGDRSQISTAILAARENVLGVTIGACLGHFFCTGLAVLGGRMIATMISVKTVTLLGGLLFVIFSISFTYMGVEKI